MFCTNCGYKLNSTDKYCPNCGKNINEHSNTMNSNTNHSYFNDNISHSYESPYHNKSGITIAALVCSLIGLFVFAYPLGIVSIILGIIGLFQPDIDKISKGQAIAAIVLGSIVILPHFLLIFFN